MTYFLGRDVKVGLSTEQANFGIKFASGAITITNTSSTTGDLGGAYADPDFVPRRAGVAEVSTITVVSTNVAQFASTTSNNKYILIYDADGQKYLVWFDHDGSGEQPSNINEDFQQEIDLSAISSGNAANIAGAIKTQLAADSDFAAAFTITQSGAVVTITDKDTGAVTDIARGSGFVDSDVTVAIDTEGTGGDASVGIISDELKIEDITGVDFTFGTVDEDIAYMGQRTALKAEIKKEITLTITKKKKDNSFSNLFNKARCGIRATTGATALSGPSDSVAFDNNLNQPIADASGSGFGYRLYLALKEGSEVMSLPNMCITEYSVTLNADAVHEETITFYGNVAPVIGTTMDFTTTAKENF
tara:strand:- start:6 stop:1088 length:1083 start_codon:yes stop_codon:yes gene_type:complete